MKSLRRNGFVQYYDRVVPIYRNIINDCNRDYEGQVINIVNQERVMAGLSPLRINYEVSNIARAKSQDMRDNRYFDHQSPTFGSPFDMLQQFRITYRSAAENIARGQRTPQAVMNSWMNSEGHRENILNPNLEEIGVGYVEDKGGNTYWTQLFITC